MIYFIQDGASGPIKIGYTSNDPEERLRTLQTGAARPLRLVGTMDGTVIDERRLHRLFQGEHVRGEWFRPVPGLLAFIREATQGPLGTTRRTRRVTPYRKRGKSMRSANMFDQTAAAPRIRKVARKEKVLKQYRRGLLVWAWIMAAFVWIESVLPLYYTYDLDFVTAKRILWLLCVVGMVTTIMLCEYIEVRRAVLES